MRHYKFIAFLILLNLSSLSGRAQADSRGTSGNLQIDSSIRYGRLPNGFTYFLRNVPSESETLLRLMHKAGSNQDDPDQRNVAHVIEHLAYESSKSFPAGIRNSDEMASLDMTIFDYGAYSGPRSTQYHFQVPTGDTTALNIGLLWFKDIISGLNLTDADIDKSSGEVLQEYLLKHNADHIDFSTNSRLNALLFPCSLDYTNYMNYLNEFDPEVLRRFYEDWYRSDLFAISIVGNIDNLDEMERLIQLKFSDIPGPENPRQLRSCYSEYYDRAPQFRIVERAKDTTRVLENNEVMVKLIYRDPLTASNFSRIEGLERMMIMQMMTSALDKRLSEVTDNYKSFDLNSMYPYSRYDLPPVMKIQMNLEDVQVKTGIQKTIQVINQLKEYGVTKNEWKKLKQRQLQYLEDTKVDAGYWATEIHEFFINGEALSENKGERLKTWLEQFSLTEFNTAVRRFFSKEPEDIGIIAPAGHPALSHPERDVRLWIEDAYEEKPEHYRMPEVPEQLLSKEEVEALRNQDYVSKRIGPSGLPEYVLGNGLKVILNNVHYSDNGTGKIYLHGFSSNGAYSFSEKDYFSAINAPAIVTNAGVNKMNKFQMKRFLANTSLPRGVDSYVNDYEAGIRSEALIDDLEVMFQLIFLYFTQPNKSQIAFEDWKAKAYRTFKNPSVQTDFRVAMKTFFGESGETDFFDVRHLSGTKRLEGIENTDFQRAHQIFRKLFGNPEDFTVILYGDFEVNAVLPLVEKYLGNIPSRSHTFPDSEKQKNDEIIPPGPSLVDLPAPEYDIENAMYGINFIKEAQHDWKKEIIIEALAGVATKKAWSLRFEKGYDLYDVSVWGFYNHLVNRYEVGSVFSSVPEEYSKIRQDFKKIISEIKSGKVSKKEFKDGVWLMYLFHDDKRKSRLMHLKIYEHYRYGEHWVDPIEEEKFARSVTIEDVVKAANNYLKEENLYEFVMKDKDIEDNL